MRIDELKNFKNEIYLTNHFNKSNINIIDTSNALMFNAYSNSGSSQIKYFWHEPATYFEDDEYINGFNSTSFTIGKGGFGFSKQDINDDGGEVQYNDSFYFNGDGLDIHVRYTSFGSDDDIHYRFGYNGFNLLGSSVTYVRDWNETQFEYLTINTPITIFNVGEVTFNTPDFVIVKMDNVFDRDYEKVKFDFNDTINLISNNLLIWQDDGGQHEDTESAELQISNSQVSINVKNITFTTEHYLQEPYDEYQVATINTGRYEFKHNGLYYNGHAPNTANGFAMLNSNSKIPLHLLPSQQLEPQLEQSVKAVSSYIENGVVTIDDLTNGLIVAVIDNDGNQVFPDIQYVNGKPIISAIYQNQDAIWTIYTYKQQVNSVNLFDMDIKNAELFDTATNLNDYAVNVGNNKVAYWTKNTVVPTTGNIYFAENVSNSNIWLKMEDKNIGGAVYGLPTGQTLNGDIHFYSKNSSFRNGAIGGAASSKCRDIYVTLENVETRGAFYCSMGEADNYYVTLNDGVYGDISNAASDFYIFQRGSGLNNTKVTTNDIYLTCNGGTFNANLIIGPNVKTKNTQTSLCCEVHDITAVLNDGFIDNETADSTSCNVYCGFISGQNNRPTASFNNIKLIINDGQWFDNINLENGKGIYSGPAVTNGMATINNCYAEMNDGEVSILYGGGYVQGNGKIDVLGDIVVVINGGTVGNVLMIEIADSITTGTGYQHVHGNTYIYINGGTITGVVNPSNRHHSDGKELIDGERYVILNGNTNHNCTFNGGLNNDTTRDSNIIFENYTGTLSSNSIVKGFKNMIFKGNTSLVFNGSWTNNSNSYDVDISKRSIDFADTLVAHNLPQPETINLTVSDTVSLQNSWKIIDNINTLPLINIVYKGNTITTVTSVNTPISNTGTILDGFQIKIENGILVLYKE